MNKVYRVIWSKVHNTWVAVSEIAKAHGKNSHSSVAPTEAVSADGDIEQKSTYGPFSRSLIAIAISFVFLQGEAAFASYANTSGTASASATGAIAIGGGTGGGR